MKNPKIHLLLLVFIGLIITACTPLTHSLFDDKTYTEKVTSFLVSEDSRQLIVVSEKHHYIFAIDDELGHFLTSSARTKYADKLRPSFQSAHVYAETNDVQIRFSIWYEDKGRKLPDELRELGFEHTSMSKSLKGKRYQAKESLPDKYKFNNEYEIYVTEKLSSRDKAMRVPLTPLTLTGDAIITIAMIPVFPIFIMACC